MKQGNEAISLKAAEIINKWKRKWVDRYQFGVDQEEHYRNFKRKKQIEAEVFKRRNEKRKKVKEFDEEEEFGEGDKDEENKEVSKKKIERKEDNFFIPQKNQFDFTYKPVANVERQENKIKPESVRGQFIRASLKMKKDFTAQQKASFAAIKPNLNPDKN